MKACFLDRDGVIIKDVHYLKYIKDIKFNKGIFRGLRKLIKLNYNLFIITNQSAVGRGLIKEKKLIEINSYIEKKLKKKNIKIKKTLYCPCHPKAIIKKYKKNCIMRKPKPGMIKKVLRNYNVKPKNCILFGDRKTDILAGENAKIKKNFLYNGKISFELFVNKLLINKKIYGKKN